MPQPCSILRFRYLNCNITLLASILIEILRHVVIVKHIKAFQFEMEVSAFKTNRRILLQRWKDLEKRMKMKGRES